MSNLTKCSAEIKGAWLETQRNLGELDDSKIVDGLAGERSIFRRRVDKSDDDGIKSKRTCSALPTLPESTQTQTPTQARDA